MGRGASARSRWLRPWTVTSLAAVAALALFGTIVVSGRHGRADATVTTVTPYGLTFSHPAAWRATNYPDDQSSFAMSLAFLSTELLHDPCITTVDRTGTSIRCQAPLDRLWPGGVLISWSSFGMPGHRLANRSGVPTTVSGHPARTVAGPPDQSCAPLGGTRTVTVEIQRQARGDLDDLVVMNACLRGPSTAANETAVRRMVQSVTFT